MLPVLLKKATAESFGLGLVTATGSLGMLFPSSLAVILYGVVAHVSIPDLFKAGSVRASHGRRHLGLRRLQGLTGGAERPRFSLGEVLLRSGGEVGAAGAVVALFGIFGGFGNADQAGGRHRRYVFVVETVIHRDLRLNPHLPRVLVKSHAGRRRVP